MKSRSRFALGGALAVTMLAATPFRWTRAQVYAPVRESGSVAEQYLMRSINAERAAAGLRPVLFDPELVAAARSHAVQMARAHTLTHQLSGEPDLTARGSAAGAHFSRITENVAVGPSILQMHDALMRSPHHRENILDAVVTHVGVSVLYANGELWAVEDFSRSVETSPPWSDEMRPPAREVVTFALTCLSFGLTNTWSTV